MRSGIAILGFRVFASNPKLYVIMRRLEIPLHDLETC
jgi:hypothetical protein